MWGFGAFLYIKEEKREGDGSRLKEFTLAPGKGVGDVEAALGEAHSCRKGLSAPAEGPWAAGRKGRL